MQLTEHFTKEELIYSDTAKRLGINNEPPLVHEGTLKHTCQYLLEPLRALLNIKYKGRLINGKMVSKVIINITSGYRCEKLNAKVGGKSTSQHQTGEAADLEAILIFTDKSKLVLNYKELFKDIKEFVQAGLLSVDQCIQERASKTGATWVHVSYSILGSTRNRKQFFEINT